MCARGASGEGNHNDNDKTNNPNTNNNDIIMMIMMIIIIIIIIIIMITIIIIIIIYAPEELLAKGFSRQAAHSRPAGLPGCLPRVSHYIILCYVELYSIKLIYIM